jgi:hypothetical protein
MKQSVIACLTKSLRTALLVAISIALTLLVLSSSLGPMLTQLTRQSIVNLTARTTSVTAAPVIVTQLQGLNRLESARLVSRHVVEAKSESPVLPAFLSKDELLMLVQTETIAGVDLSRLSASDVKVDDDAVTLHLPLPRIFSVRIEDNHSQVFQRNRGWFVFNPDKDLERQARLKATMDARHAAKHSGMMATAKTNAEANLRKLFQSLGFRKVTFQWDDEFKSS